MLSRRLTRGALITSALVAPVTAVVASMLIVDHAATPRDEGRRPVPAVDGEPAAWQRGPSFSTQAGCYDYAGRQIWPVWECRHEGSRWRYYWTEPTGDAGKSTDSAVRPRPMTGLKASPYAVGQTARP